MPYVLEIADDILIVRYDADDRDNNRNLRWVMPFFRKVISREGVKPDPKKLCTLTEMSLINNKELQSCFRYNELPGEVLIINCRGM